MDDGRLSPFEPDELDEVLSAELDGELDALARDLGTDVDALTARLRTTPGVAARRAALTAARDRFAEVPALDELSAARLRDVAVRAAEHGDAFRADLRRRRRSRWLLSAGGAAAAIAAIAGLAVGLGRGLGGNDNAKSSSAPLSAAAGTTNAPTAPIPLGPVTALGAYADQRALGQAAVARGEAVRSTAATKSPANPNQDTASGPATTPAGGLEENKSTVTSTAASPGAAFASGDTAAPPPSSQPKSAESDSRLAARAASTCAAPPQVPVSSQPILRATATLAGVPVVVLVYAESNEHIVVIEDARCTLLHWQTLG